MRRREFMTFLGSAAAWPLAIRAQERIGQLAALMQYTEDSAQGQRWVAALRDDLRKRGWIEGRNLRMSISHLRVVPE
jgi:putative ABC transport system substrate-binding protein